MSQIEELMKQEISLVEEKIRENQKEYRKLRKEYDSKRNAMQKWLKPTIRPRVKNVPELTQSPEESAPNAD